MAPQRMLLTTIAASFFLYSGCGSKDEQNFIDCLIEKKVKLYSAHWCAPCHQQEDLLKDELGEDWEYFNENLVIQCYGENDSTIIQWCKDKKIGFYPAWEYPGNNPEWKYGVQSLEQITTFTGCEYK